MVLMVQMVPRVLMVQMVPMVLIYLVLIVLPPTYCCHTEHF